MLMALQRRGGRVVECDASVELRIAPGHDHMRDDAPGRGVKLGSRIGLAEDGAWLPGPRPIVLRIAVERELWRSVQRLRRRGDLAIRAEVALDRKSVV